MRNNLMLVTAVTLGASVAIADGKLVSVVNPTDVNIAMGIGTSEEISDFVIVNALVNGVEPRQKHSTHVHEAPTEEIW